MTKQPTSLFDLSIVRAAALSAVRKLDPRHVARNPVMFLVEVGSVIVTVLFVKDFGDSSTQENVFAGAIAAWLWITVLFANFAEAMAEGRGKAQAATLRRTRAETLARKRQDDGSIVEVPSAQLVAGDVVVVSAGNLIPADGDVVEGIATVDESAITGESAPVIRESGGDRSAVTGGTRVLSDQIVVLVTARPGESFLDRMIALVEGAVRRKTPNEIALDILLAGLTITFLVAVVTLQPFAIYSDARQSTDRARRAPRLPDPHHDRRAALRDRHRGHGSPRAAERAGALGPCRRGGGRLRRAPARQDRHDHAREPPGDRADPRPRRHAGAAGRRGAALEPRGRDPRRTLDRRAREGAVRPPRARPRRRRARPVLRPHANERHRSRRPLGAQGRGRRDRAVDRRRRWIRPARAPGRRRRDRHLRRHAARGRRERPCGRRRPPEGRRQGGDARALRRDAPDGHPDRDDHRRQPADGEGDRRRVGCRRLPRRGDARGQDGAHPPRAGFRSARGDDRATARTTPPRSPRRTSASR